MFWIGTSWKMNKTRAQAQDWCAELVASPMPDKRQYQLFVIPPFTAIDSTREALGDSSVLIGAQNVHQERSGAYTGEISATMLAEAGCNLVEMGHSERRALFAETDDAIALKVRSVLDAGLRPLVCVGDSGEQKQAGNAVDAVVQQAKIALSKTTTQEQHRCLLAYEPVWAIGVNGTAATAADIQPVHHALKQLFADVCVLYGGSVDENNAAQLAAIDNVDGLFIGRAALQASRFLTIINKVTENDNL